MSFARLMVRFIAGGTLRANSNRVDVIDVMDSSGSLARCSVDDSLLMKLAQGGNRGVRAVFGEADESGGVRARFGKRASHGPLLGTKRQTSPVQWI